MYFRIYMGLLFIVLFQSVYSQTKYEYKVDLTNVADDRLTVDLVCPAVDQDQIIYYMPKIVPGTYMNSNFGKYISNLKAFTKEGQSLPVKKRDDNSWVISKARQLHHLSYSVEDTWDAAIDNEVYEMVGTNFEAGKNFVLNTCGVFGYLDGFRKTPFELSFTKPEGFYAATGLRPVSTGSTADLFRCETVDELYDSPIMYSLPDTATLEVGGAQVLIALYSPHKLAHAQFIADHFRKLMEGSAAYLKGKLPVDKYAFIFYFNGEQKPFQSSGAWEHSYSSFYALSEAPEEQAIENWISIAAHEFFHIVTPLTISSREVKEFNFNETVLSKHLWLYEGSTEYYSNHMQVWAGLQTPEEFIAEMETKIRYSRMYFNDSLSLAELSRESAGKWHAQYPNIYMKGALVSACLDLLLLKLSGGQYSLRDLKHDLGIRYGKDRYFLDDELYDEIARLSYPEVREFLVKYVDGADAIPYEYYFGLAGIDYQKKKTIQTINLGNVLIKEEKGVLVVDAKNMNDFGKTVGYQTGDELVSINGEAASLENIAGLVRKFNTTAQAGDRLEVQVRRKTKGKNREPLTLSATVVKSDRIAEHVLEINNSPSPSQLLLRKAWWGKCACE